MQHTRPRLSTNPSPTELSTEGIRLTRFKGSKARKERRQVSKTLKAWNSRKAG